MPIIFVAREVKKQFQYHVLALKYIVIYSSRDSDDHVEMST